MESFYSFGCNSKLEICISATELPSVGLQATALLTLSSNISARAWVLSALYLIQTNCHSSPFRCSAIGLMAICVAQYFSYRMGGRLKSDRWLSFFLAREVMIHCACPKWKRSHIQKRVRRTIHFWMSHTRSSKICPHQTEKASYFYICVST